MHWIKSQYNNNQSVYFRPQPFFVCTASDLQQARQRCCPLLQSAKIHPEPRGQTCPSNPSAPACPHSPPWMTCCLLVLYTAKGKWGISEHCSRTRQQQWDCFFLAEANGHVQAGWHSKWISLYIMHTNHIWFTLPSKACLQEIPGNSAYWICRYH